MENQKCGCGETLEINNESHKDEPEESKENKCCETESVDESTKDEIKEDSGCGCGCGR